MPRAGRWLMSLAPEARPFILICLAMVVVAALAGGVSWAVPAAILLLFVLYFFRDPHRVPPEGEGLIISPADGRVVEIKEVDDAAFPGGRARRVSIFLSIFDVHVNRAPVACEVSKIRYSRGRFRAAFHGKASDENERNRMDLSTSYGPLAVTQIAGAIARRIVCDLEVGDQIQVGDRMGLIRFGSRVDLFLPLAAKLRVKKGQKVRTSLTIMAFMVAPDAEGSHGA